jgi:hypothetical protein
MTQKTYERVRRIELELGVAPSHYESNAPHAQAQSPVPGSPAAARVDPAGAGRERPEQREGEAVRL